MRVGVEQKAIKKDKLKRKGERKRKKTKRKKNQEWNLFMNVKTFIHKSKTTEAWEGSVFMKNCKRWILLESERWAVSYKRENSS